MERKNKNTKSLVLVALLALGGCGIQSIPMSENQVEAAWAEVLNQYQRRADLIPNLVETVKGYAKHEQQTFTAVVEARSKATQLQIQAKDLNEETMKKFQQAQAELKGALGRLLAVAEAYPNLKASDNFRDLTAQLEGTENRITVARQRYIESIQKFNNLVTVFPTSLTNTFFFKHSKKPQFSVENETEIKKAPGVSF